MESTGVSTLAIAFGNHYGWAVRQGEFQGLKLLQQSVGSALLPKLLGSYEEELHATFREVRNQNWDAVVDVGCAEGFYAVGLAKILPSCPKIYAFDLTPKSRRLCAELAKLNCVEDRLLVRTRCDDIELTKITSSKKCLVISDCEGFEAELFSSQSVQHLDRSLLIIELHEHNSPNVTSQLLCRFDQTHNTKIIQIRKREKAQYSDLNIFDRDADKLLAVNEFRFAEQAWLIATPKATLGEQK